MHAAVTKRATLDDMDYGTAIASVENLPINEGYSLTHVDDEPKGHVSLHCTRCDGKEAEMAKLNRSAAPLSRVPMPHY